MTPDVLVYSICVLALSWGPSGVKRSPGATVDVFASN